MVGGIALPARSGRNGAYMYPSSPPASAKIRIPRSISSPVRYQWIFRSSTTIWPFASSLSYSSESVISARASVLPRTMTIPFEESVAKKGSGCEHFPSAACLPRNVKNSVKTSKLLASLPRTGDPNVVTRAASLAMASPFMTGPPRSYAHSSDPARAPPGGPDRAAEALVALGAIAQGAYMARLSQTRRSDGLVEALVPRSRPYDAGQRGGGLLPMLGAQREGAEHPDLAG